jgi:hypothetical protein
MSAASREDFFFLMDRADRSFEADALARAMVVVLKGFRFAIPRQFPNPPVNRAIRKIL